MCIYLIIMCIELGKNFSPSLFVPVNRFHGECGQADGDVLGAAFLWSGVADHSPAWAMTACPAWTSREPFLVLDSQQSLQHDGEFVELGVWPGSSHPWGLRMWATLAAEVLELTRPMYSSMSLGLLPAAVMRVGCGISVGMGWLQEYNKRF